MNAARAAPDHAMRMKKPGATHVNNFKHHPGLPGGTKTA